MMNERGKSIVQIYLVGALVILLGNQAFSQSIVSLHPKWKRVNLDDRFSFELPQTKYQLIRAADVDGGTFFWKNLEISFTYWTDGGHPNYLDAPGKSYRKQLSCTSWRRHCTKRKIGKWHALIWQTKAKTQLIGLGNTLVASFPKVLIDYGDKKYRGEFHITVTYLNRRYRHIARHIINSLNLSA